MNTGTSGYDCKLEKPDLNSRSDNDPFDKHEVWLNHPLKRLEVRTGTSGYSRLVKMIKSESPADNQSFEVHKIW